MVLCPVQICEVFSANKYPFPEDIARQKQMATEVSGRLRELLTTNEAGERRRDVVLKEIAYHLASWTTMVSAHTGTHTQTQGSQV